jgi:hypothetical protein
MNLPGDIRLAVELGVVSDIITPQVANHVLWWLRHDLGYEPGPFTLALLQTVRYADPNNRGKLRAAFPGYVLALDLYDGASSMTDGIERLQLLAGHKITYTNGQRSVE